MTSAHQPVPDDPAAPPIVFPGGGEAGVLVRAIDWSKTPLGPVQSWPQALKALLRTILHAPHPIFLFWGPSDLHLTKPVELDDMRAAVEDA